MSVDVVAIMGHHLDSRAAKALPRTLQSAAASELVTATTALFSFLKPYYPLLTVDGGWQVKGYYGMATSDAATAWTRGELVWIEGPAGLSLGIGRRLCELGFYMLWSTFLADPTAETLVRQVCSALVRLLGSERVLYVPDSAYCASGVSDLEYEGASFEDAERWLREHCGPPAVRPSQIINPAVGKGYRYDVDPNGYLIDRPGEQP